MMCEHYVTLFDSLFLPQGIALHLSMERHVTNYVLWILCVDDEAYTVLSKLQLPNTRLLSLKKLEINSLCCVKEERSKGEYCWTLTPFAPHFVFEADPSITRVTYLDADLWFLKDTVPIFQEFEASGKKVLITDHAYAPEYDYSATSGKYCVQFMSFVKEGGEIVRKWWEERCLEWCYARYEDGKFGDQKYLDDWPQRFEQLVHILQKPEFTLAPWNATRFPYSDGIFWHFHSLRIENGFWGGCKVNLGMYHLPNITVKNVYLPYLEDLKTVRAMLNSVGFIVRPQQKQSLARKVKSIIVPLIKHFLYIFPARNLKIEGK